MLNPEKEIRSANKVVDFFGKWPTFHDGEIIKMVLERDGPSLEIQLFTFSMLKEIDEKGYYKQDKRCIITFRFLDIEELEIVDFNQQNVIFGINFEIAKAGKIEVKIEPCYGASATFICKDIEIVSVIPTNNNSKEK